MSFSSPYEASLTRASLRAISTAMGGPHRDMPVPSILAALAKHGGMYTLLDPTMMSSRAIAFAPEAAPDVAQKARQRAENFFYKLVDTRGYTIHSELMAYIAEPGRGNGVCYDEGVTASDIPAVFTFVGQFIDHDLTFNGMNLTADQRGAVFPDEASPVIDLDSVYGPDPAALTAAERASVLSNIFDAKGRFVLRSVRHANGHHCGFDANRYEAADPSDPVQLANQGKAYLFDPRNDENQLLLQLHLLVQRFHNALIDNGLFTIAVGEDPLAFAQRVRDEVLPTWQSIVRYDYLPRILLDEVLQYLVGEIAKPALPGNEENEYGEFRHKPYRDLVHGLPRNVVRMPHEFAIGFRFGHSQLRPMYRLNKTSGGAYRAVLLFRDARASGTVSVDISGSVPPTSVTVDGSDDLRGSRPLRCEHVVDWDVFYPKTAPDVDTRSMLIDGLVTARVFNLPESAIPDDIKYIGNLPHRNLIRSSQIGIVSGEELVAFYSTPARPIVVIDPAAIVGFPQPVVPPGGSDSSAYALFKLDNPIDRPDDFKTPLWFYLLKEAEQNPSAQRGRLGPVGSRLVGEVLLGALYYSDRFAFRDGTIPAASGPWKSVVFKDAQHGPVTAVSLHNLIDYVHGTYQDGLHPPPDVV